MLTEPLVLIHIAKHTYYNSKLEDAKNDLRTTWKLLNKVIKQTIRTINLHPHHLNPMAKQSLIPRTSLAITVNYDIISECKTLSVNVRHYR